MLVKCNNRSRCEECKRKHHTLLHTEKKPQDEPTQPTTSNLSPNATVFQVESNFAMESSSVLLATTKILLSGPDERLWTIRALIDPGSQCSFITENIVQRAKLKKLPTQAIVTGFGNTETGRSQNVVNAVLKSLVLPNIGIKAEAVVLKNLTNFLPSSHISANNWPNVMGLQLADPTYNKPGSIDMVLGADIYPQILLDGLKKPQHDGPVAQNTVFGWILSGPTTSNETRAWNVKAFYNSIQLDEILTPFWEMEEYISPRHESEDDKNCEEFYRETHRRDKNGKYIVRLPFINKNEGPLLGNSKRIALKRLEHVENRLRKNAKLKEQYEHCINEYETLGHMKKIEATESESGPHCFIPHHAAIKEESVSTKLRVVFDASCKTTNGKSLNDQMYIGPRLQPDLTAILTRWRVFKVVFCTDVEKMYRQIFVAPEDSKFQRILWRNENGIIENFELVTVTFGTSSAPWLAIRTLKQLAEDEEVKYRQAAQVIRENVYVDDIMTGRTSIENWIRLRHEVQQMFLAGGFQLRKWASNHSKVLDGISQSDRIIEFVPQEEDIIKTLGIFWAPLSDEFQFKVQPGLSTKPITKREVLSWLARIYDPLGWIAPVLITAKILIQTLWQEGLGWDEKLSVQSAQIWNNLAREIQDLQKLKIPRWIGSDCDNQIIEIHGFSDASEKAYGAVVYSKITNTCGEIQISLIMAKTKVAPLKTVRLPRLELAGAVLLSKLLVSVQKNLGFKESRIFAWTDSKIALAWIKSSPCRWPTFVANRVADIHDLTGPHPWRYVPTKENPADCCTRGITPQEFVNFHLWWRGPKWLWQTEDFWPCQNITPVDEKDLQYKKIKAFSSKLELVDGKRITALFSEFTKLIRISTWCIRFMENCRLKSKGKPLICGYLTSVEYQETLHRFIRVTQKFHFSTEVEALQGKQSRETDKTYTDSYQISKKSSIYSLLPFMDEERVLRVRGRLGKSAFPYTERFPIIMPHHSELTYLIIVHAHRSTLHGGLTQTLAYVRRQYWILKARVAVQYVIRRCVICARLKNETQTQLMGDLPRARLEMSPPFTNVGVDYAGPIMTRPSNLRGRAAPTLKGYIAVFVCMATKAIHIEFVSDLSTQAFLAAFRRFTSRRGLCTNLFSDCGTNFIGASNEFEKEIQRSLSEESEIPSALISQGIQWHFIPPGAPHFGGIWEAGVKSIKHHLRRIVGKHILTFEEMTTTLTQIEACLNSRPLSPMSDDHENLDYLTPGHFLIGRALLSTPLVDLTSVNINLLDRWNLVQKFQQDFWNSWRSEYLSRLQQRPKWLQPENNIEKGDLVLVKDERLPPLHWRLGRIINVHPGEDQLVRVVSIKTQQGEIRRPITKICLLPIRKATD